MSFSFIEKAKKMKVEIVNKTEKAVYFKVISTSGNEYMVSIQKDGKFACDCAHFAMHPGTLCSHVIAAILKLYEKETKS